MKEYNKHAKLFYCIFASISFVAIICALVYMTQYQNLFLYETVNGVQSGINATNLNNNSDWFNFISNNTTVMQQLGFTNTDVSTTFKETTPIILSMYKSLQDVNDLLLWLGIVGVVTAAVMLIFGNGSRRIFYKSNLISGIVGPLIMAVLSIVVFVLNTSMIGKLNENLALFQTMDYAVENGTASYSGTLDMITSNTSVSSTTFILIDVILFVTFAYSVFLVVYACKRYNGCKEEREKIIKKAVEFNEQ